MVNFKVAYEEALENIEHNVKKAAKQQVQAVAQSVKSQVAGGGSDSDGTNETGNAAQQQGMRDDQYVKDFVQDLYAPSAPLAKQAVQNQQHGTGQKPSQFVQQLIQQGKTPEEAKHLEALRKKLHEETYYIPLTKRAEQQQKEERPSEKVEREKMEELKLEETKQKEKPPPLAVQMGRNKAEQFPGVSG